MTHGGSVAADLTHSGPMPRHWLNQSCHFGEWLQGKAGPGGPLALVTLVPEQLVVTARRRPSHRALFRSVGHGQLCDGKARKLLRLLDLPTMGQVAFSLPFAPGLGTGMSTATLVALARLQGHCGQEAALARACVAVEGASDPLMFARPDRLIWASREAQAIALAPAVPRAHLLGGFFGPPRPTRAEDEDYDDISDLLADWQRPLSLAARAELASESARRCLARRGPQTDPTAGLARSLGALGWTVSHSGAARALVFAPGTIPPDGPDALRRAGLRGVLRFATGG